MPVVTKEQLKIWFSNFKKPPEGEFWSWLDSYRHKLEKVPVDDVEGLTEKLQKKADLVDGVVPEHQLPFSVVTSEVITLGTVSHTDNVLNLAVHSSGANKVRVKGRTITRTFPNNWNTTPIADNGVKVIRGYAVKNEDDFFISEGAELPEFELPEIPEDALQLFIVTITNAGATIDTGGEGGFKTKAESGWKSLVFTSNIPRWIVLNSDESVFDIIAENGATPLISGLLTKGGKWIYPGKEYTLFNASGIDVIIRRNDVRPPFNPLAIANYLTFPVGADIIIKPGEYFRFKIKGTELVVLKFASDIDFSLYALDADLDAEIVNRAIADLALDGKITTEKNRNDTQDSAIAANTTAIALKLDKPTVISDISNIQNLVGIDPFGATAKIPAGIIDFVSLLFVQNFKYWLTYSTGYVGFRAGNNVVLQGNSWDMAQSLNGMIYSSSGSTGAWQRGAPFWITSTIFKQVRKFKILTTVTTQRIFIGLGNFRNSNPINAALTTLVDFTGIGMIENSNKIFFIHNNNSGSATLVDSGFVNDPGVDQMYILTITRDSMGTVLIRLDQYKSTGVFTSVCNATADYGGVWPVLAVFDSLNASVVKVKDYGIYETQENQ